MQDTLDNKIKVLVWISLFLIGVHGVNELIFNRHLSGFGIQPGNVSGLPFILIAPFLHGSWSHLFQNLFGLLLFGGFCLFRGISFFLKSSVIILVVTGVLVWGFARPTVHIGASGWVFGLWSLTIALAIFQFSFQNIAIATFVVVFYGGMFSGLFPQSPNISHESHMFGALAGFFSAFLMSRFQPITAEQSVEEEPDDGEFEQDTEPPNEVKS